MWQRGDHSLADTSPSISTPVLPHLDVSFTIPSDKDLVIFISGHGTHNHILVVFDVCGELPQQASIPMDGPGIDVAVSAAAQQGSRVWQARPALQEDYLCRRGGPSQLVAVTQC